MTHNFCKFQIDYDFHTNQTNSIFPWLGTNSAQLCMTSILQFNSGHYSRSITTTDSSVPMLRIGTFILVVCALGFFPFHRSRRFSCSLQKPISCSCDLYADYHPDSNQVSSGLLPATSQISGFDSNVLTYDTSSALHLRSAP